jgi:hypothetical protein
MKPSRILLAATLVLLGVGCGGGQTGTVSVLLKDAPGNFDEAVVTISEVDLVGSGGTTVLTTKKTTADLLKLTNATVELLKDVEVPVGTYSQLRFVITGGYVLTGGVYYASSPTYEGLPQGVTATGMLQMPSYGQSGLKVDLPADAATVATGSHVILVDFDVSQSFGQDAGGSGMWAMHPVMHATNIEFTGDVDVTLTVPSNVTLPAGAILAAQVTSSDGTDVHKADFVATAPGTYVADVKYLFPGTYTLTIVSDNPNVNVSFTTTPATPVTVTVTSGQATSESFTLASAAAQ